ncbi:MAG TPA: hypothetical protein PK816_00725 [Candidatus Cloacimonadota bacterium]|nr:hypothetical protein [Candidatus Cloacimonadota bacterium]
MRIYFSEKVTDFPKKVGDLHLAWYQNGKICISRNLKSYKMQVQNFNIVQVNQITKAVWDTLNISFRKDLAQYAVQYKKTYPGLRKRGISAYSTFLIVVHSLIKRFGIDTSYQENAIAIFKRILNQVSVYKLVQLKILKSMRFAYRLNHYNFLNDEKKNSQISLYFQKTDLKSAHCGLSFDEDYPSVIKSTIFFTLLTAFT